MPSDHIFEENIFLKISLPEIVNLQNDKNWILFGVKPLSASTQYGYMQIDFNEKHQTIISSKTLYDVKAFIEKPSIKNARNFYKNKCYCWNSGMFLGNSSMILSDFKVKSPKISQSCDFAFQHSLSNDQNNEISFRKDYF